MKALYCARMRLFFIFFWQFLTMFECFGPFWAILAIFGLFLTVVFNLKCQSASHISSLHGPLQWQPCTVPVSGRKMCFGPFWAVLGRFGPFMAIFGDFWPFFKDLNASGHVIYHPCMNHYYGNLLLYYNSAEMCTKCAEIRFFSHPILATK